MISNVHSNTVGMDMFGFDYSARDYRVPAFLWLIPSSLPSYHHIVASTFFLLTSLLPHFDMRSLSECATQT